MEGVGHNAGAHTGNMTNNNEAATPKRISGRKCIDGGIMRVIVSIVTSPSGHTCNDDDDDDDDCSAS